jgi:hypothetical protein
VKAIPLEKDGKPNPQRALHTVSFAFALPTCLGRR